MLPPTSAVDIFFQSDYHIIEVKVKEFQSEENSMVACLHSQELAFLRRLFNTEAH